MLRQVYALKVHRVADYRKLRKGRSSWRDNAGANFPERRFPGARSKMFALPLRRRR
jgi:hypothetical protein